MVPLNLAPLEGRKIKKSQALPNEQMACKGLGAQPTLSFLTTIAGCPTPPDFLCSVIRSTHFMRLSLMKAAHAAVAGAAYRKSGYLARFSRDVGYHGSLPEPSLGVIKLEGRRGGIPHLAKNERDMGHPAIVVGTEKTAKRFAPFIPSSTCCGQVGHAG